VLEVHEKMGAEEVTILEILSEQADWSSGCIFDLRKLGDIFIQPRCEASNACNMFLGNFTSVDDFYLTNSEVNMISNAQNLYIGDWSNNHAKVDLLVIDGLTVTKNTTANLYLQANTTMANVTFVNQRSDIYPSLYLSAYRAINIETDVNTYSHAVLRPNCICSNTEAINTLGNVSFESEESVLFLGDLDIRAGSINSKGEIIIREVCQIGTSAMIGGFAGTSGFILELTEDELHQINAPNIVLDYPLHAVQISALLREFDGSIVISTNYSLSVMEITSWKTVTMVSAGAIELGSNITTTAGDLMLNFTTKLEIASGVHLK
jgi:hypothetical protein